LSSTAVAVRPVETAADWRAFHSVPRAIYRGDPHAVRPLASEQRLVLDRERHPFWQHADYRAFVAWRGKTAVGRIAAITDRMHDDQYGAGTGFFGFFECGDDQEAACALIDAAAAALAARGCSVMQGPVNPSLKGEFGVLVQGNDMPPALMMAYTPARYETLLKGYGLEKVHDFYAFMVEKAGIRAHDEAWRELGRFCERIRARHPEINVA
jgi:hypothetical protein